MYTSSEHVVCGRELPEILLEARIYHALCDPRLDGFGYLEAIRDVYWLEVIICVPHMPLLGNARETVVFHHL